LQGWNKSIDTYVSVTDFWTTSAKTAEAKPKHQKNSEFEYIQLLTRIFKASTVNLLLSLIGKKFFTWLTFMHNIQNPLPGVINVETCNRISNVSISNRTKNHLNPVTHNYYFKKP
jgi:hypothetical protein